MPEGDREATASAEVGYYYPEPYWRLEEVDQVKTLLLFFDRIAILLPSYMAGREVSADPVLAHPLKERGLLMVLEPEKFVDKEMTEGLTSAILGLIGNGAFDNLDKSKDWEWAPLSQSR